MERKCQIKKRKIHVNTEKYDCSILESDRYDDKNFVFLK